MARVHFLRRSIQHQERHFRGGSVVRDIVLGMSDGLTVPFALAAGLSGAVASSRVVLTAGAAEIVAGAISMGLGGYLAARADAEHYATEEKREAVEVVQVPKEEEAEIVKIFAGYGVTPAESAPIVEALRRDPKQWVDFMMRYELGLEAPEPRRALTSAGTIALAYIIGGVIPLAPYLALSTISRALVVSVVVTLIALAAFGAAKGRILGGPVLRHAAESVIIGGLAAGVAFLLARAIT